MSIIRSSLMGLSTGPVALKVDLVGFVVFTI